MSLSFSPLPRSSSHTTHTSHPILTCTSRTSRSSCSALIVATLASLLLLDHPASAAPSTRKNRTATSRERRPLSVQCGPAAPQLCLTPPPHPSRPRLNPYHQQHQQHQQTQTQKLSSSTSHPRMSPKLFNSPPAPSHMHSRIRIAKRQYDERAGKDNSALAAQEHQHSISNSPRSLSSDSELSSSTGQVPSSSSRIRLSNISPTGKALSAVLGVVLLLVLVGLGVCCMKKRSKSRAQTLPQIQTQPQQQPSSIPQHQPPETPSSLSSFTRISPATPEMSAVLSPGRATSARPGSTATAAFNIARFFAKQSGSSSASKGGRSVYLHQGQDHSLQKTPSATPSTRSSTNDYFWDLSHSRKERSKDGFPVITLTSPTNSETSIPMSHLEEPQISFLYSAERSPSSTSLPAVASSSSAAPSLHAEGTRIDLPNAPVVSSLLSSSSSSSSSPTSSPPLIQPPEQGSSSSSLHIERHHQNLYILQQSVPQHMLLHPSYTYSRPPQLEKQAPTPTSLTLADFPPTYEEAIDGAGPSNSVGPPSEAASSASPILPKRSPGTNHSTLSVLQANLSAASQPYGSSSSDVPLYDVPPWRESALEGDRWDPDSGAEVDIEVDPLTSLSLRPSISIGLQDSAQ
ncbi:hypothetical protein EDD21DRAFT_383009 [Dissophora ornata]|nr:hypothetical protein EDD21DRAFT_383009 [Dissophora ornata]